MTPQQRWRERNRAFVNARQRERDEKKRAEREPRHRTMGLEELRSRSKPGECPFCGDPVKAVPSSTKKYLYCGDEICLAAYHRYYGVDRRRKGRNEYGDQKRTNQGNSGGI